MNAKPRALAVFLGLGLCSPAALAPRSAAAATVGSAFASVSTFGSTSVSTAAPARERRGHLEVDASSLGESASLIVDRIQEMTPVVFERESVRVTDAPDDPVLKVVIVRLDEDTAGYRITYQVERAGERVPGSEGRADCRLCTEGELVDAVIASIELVAEKMEVAIEEAPPPEPPKPDEPGGDNPGGDIVAPPPPPPDEPGRLGVLGKTGIALIVVGAAGLGTGIGLVIRKPTPSDKEPTKQLNTRVPGYAALAAGAAVAVGGVVLLVLDRKGKGPRNTAVVPFGGAGEGGLLVQGRF